MYESISQQKLDQLLQEEGVLVRDIRPRLNEIGPDGLLRSHVFFDYLQDIAGEHASLLGVGIHDLKKLRILWVLSRIHLKILRFPNADDAIRLITYPSGISRLFATRQFLLVNPVSRDVFAAASSFWLMLDDASLRPKNPLPILQSIRFPKNESLDLFFPECAKLLPARELLPVASFRVGQSGIDYNDHLNNAFYALFTQDALAQSLDRLIRFQEIEIQYNHAVRFGETVACSGYSDSHHNFFLEGTAPDGINAFQSAGTFSFLDHVINPVAPGTKQP